MPELPEVQTIVDDLNRKVRGRTIVAAWEDWAKFRAVKKSVGLKIEKVIRKGKNILFFLSRHPEPFDRHSERSEKSQGKLRKGSSRDSSQAQNDKYILLVHQKMTGHLLVGKWRIEKKKTTPLAPAALKERVNTYIHFILTLDDGRMIGLSDLRKFGKVVFGSVADIEQLPDITHLGPDALDPTLTLEVFTKQITKPSWTIYQVLMDQSVIAGIGNIYASEILHEARVYPFLSAKKITNEQEHRLFLATRKILKLSVQLRGTSYDDYRDTAGKPGAYAERRLVYQRANLPCYTCGTKIKRVKRGGRSAFFCPRCQRISGE